MIESAGAHSEVLGVESRVGVRSAAKMHRECVTREQGGCLERVDMH